MARTKVALLGAGFIADIHIESYHRFVPDAEVVAVFTRAPDRAEAFATKHRIGKWFGDLDKAISTLQTGFGTAVCEYATAHRLPTEDLTRLGMPDRLIAHATRKEQLTEVGLDPAGIARSVRDAVRAAVTRKTPEPDYV